MDFTAGPWLCGIMRYRIDMSQSRKGYARIDLPGRILALEANRHVGPVWLVGISDLAGEAEKSVGDGSGAAGSVVVRAGSAGEAVWRVARAAAEITGTPPENTIEDTIESGCQDSGLT
jgi:hypothetical protein